MLAQLGLIGTLRDEDQSPEEPDTESEPEVSPYFCTKDPFVKVGFVV